VTAPTQAVILCGGLGTRLRPLTDNLPKPMAPVNGRPFLAYLIDQLREQGLERILLLTGYRGDMIREAFGSGSKLGVQIEYSEGPAEWETGRRVWEARSCLDPRFVLLYSDNFAQFDLKRLLAAHARRPAPLTLVLRSKARGNIRLGGDGAVELYDSSRNAAGLDYVEIGYMLVDREPVLAELDHPDVSFSRVIASLTAQGRVSALASADAYHSISDHDRLRLMESYLAAKRVLLIDRDGTINQRAPKGEYVTAWEHFHWIDDTVDAMAALARRGFSFVIISNQAGIARGMQDPAMVDDINRRMVAALAARGIPVLGVYVCPHHWDDGCECRKPAPGLFFRASREHLLRMDRTAYVGDDVRDCQAAFNAGCLSIMVGPERHHETGTDARAAFASQGLGEAVPWILSQFERWEAAVEVV
jgi:D-glycero-D-manno-heptose 1,7-bisphosphate phosphatase